MASPTTLIKDPNTGAFTLAPGAGSAPLGGSPNVSDLGIGGGGVGTGRTAGDPYSIFSKNLASILSQIQNAANAGRQNLSGAKDALTVESVGAGGAYDATAAPSVNLQKQQGTLSAFAPAVTSVSTQLANADAAIKDLETSVGTIAQTTLPQKVGPGESLITPGGDVIHQGHQYTPQVNPNTGLLDGFDINTGTWQSDDKNGGSVQGASTSSDTTPTSPMGTTAGPLEKIFGKSNPIGAYATDPNYISEISGLYDTVSGSHVAENADTLQQYINNNAKSSPVTGQMIMNAASTYKIDPALLTTILLHESDFGTAGVAVKTMNPGNQGNTGTSTQAFNSWQQGVMATAKNIAARIAKAADAPAVAGATTETPTTSTSPVGGTFSAAATQKIQSLPAAYRSYVDAGPLGIAYINSDRVPDTSKVGLQTMASRAGIPYVQAADVGVIKSIETVLSNLDSMQTLADKNLGKGLTGRAINSTIGRGAEFLQTDWGRQLGLFDNYRDVAIKAVQALAGGAGSGLRINMGEIAANTQNLPKSSDNLENATANIKQLKQLIYTQLATTFPYAEVPVMNPQGQEGTIPVGNLGAAIKSGFTVK